MYLGRHCPAFFTHDLEVPPPTPSISLCSPRSGQIPSPGLSESSEFSNIAGNLSIGEHCIPPVKSITRIPVHVLQYYNPRAVMALKSPIKIKKAVLPLQTSEQSLPTNRGTTTPKDELNNKGLVGYKPFDKPTATTTSPPSPGVIDHDNFHDPQQVLQGTYGHKKPIRKTKFGHGLTVSRQTIQNQNST